MILLFVGILFLSGGTFALNLPTENSKSEVSTSPLIKSEEMHYINLSCDLESACWKFQKYIQTSPTL